ncbi:MAG: phosphate transporter permease subunit PstC, partial [Pseudomonadota bacterium]
MSRGANGRKVFEKIVEGTLALCSSFSILTTLGIIAVLSVESVLFFREVSLSQFIFDSQWTPLFLEKHFGIWPLIAGTVLTSAIALALSVPAGLIIAIYVSEFAEERTRKILKPLLELLAGIPTIVYGYFALLVITPILQQVFPTMGSFNALSAGIAMGIM